jgi:hypothetical protein
MYLERLVWQVSRRRACDDYTSHGRPCILADGRDGDANGTIS